MTKTEAVWWELSEALRAYLARRVGDPALVEDLLQEVFVRVHRGVERAPEGERLAPWVFRIASNLVVDHYRRRGVVVPMEAPPEVAAEDEAEAPHVPLERALGAWLLGRIETLPELYRVPVRLSEVEGLSQRDIASQLGLPYSTVKSRVQRGRAKLAKDLAECCDVTRDRRGRVLEVEPRGCGC